MFLTHQKAFPGDGRGFFGFSGKWIFQMVSCTETENYDKIKTIELKNK